MKRGFAPWLLLLLGGIVITIGVGAYYGLKWKANNTLWSNVGHRGHGHGVMEQIQEHLAIQNQTHLYNYTEKWVICACNKDTGACRWFSKNALNQTTFQEHWEVTDRSKCEGVPLPGRRE